MTTRRDAATHAAAAGQERAHLAQLGLEPGASAKQIAEAHDALIAYLAAAPRSVRPWARRRIAEVEASYAGLQAGLPAPRASGSAARGYIASDAEDAEELLDALDDSGRGAPPRRVAPQPNRLASARPALASGLDLGRGSTLRRLGLGVGALAVVAVGVFAVYKLGEPTVPGLTGTPAPGATAGVDQAQVVALMEKLAANPKDVASLRALADLYYAAGDNATSRSWLLKVLEIEPKNIEALLGSGATAYNLDDFAAAEQAWRAVLAIDPKNVDAHYDLGLMYFSMDPPDLARMREAWNKVVELAPDSQLASIVKTHMPDPSSSAGSSSGPTAEPSAAPSAAPTNQASPAATPAASPS